MKPLPFDFDALLRPSPRLLVLLAVSIFIVSLAATFPARLAAGWASQRIPAIHLEGVNGTLWRGSAELAAVQLRGKWLSLGRLQWQLSPAALLLARVQLQVDATAKDREISGTAIAGLGGDILLREALVLSNAALVSAWLPAGLNIEGDISLRIRHFLWSKGLQEVDASLGWQNSQVEIQGGALAFGNLAADFSLDEAGYLLAALEDFGGPLEVQGTLWYNSGAFGASGRIVPRQNAGAPLLQRLRDFAGQPGPDGAFLIDLGMPLGSPRPQCLTLPEGCRGRAKEPEALGGREGAAPDTLAGVPATAPVSASTAATGKPPPASQPAAAASPEITIPSSSVPASQPAAAASPEITTPSSSVPASQPAAAASPEITAPSSSVPASQPATAASPGATTPSSSVPASQPATAASPGATTPSSSVPASQPATAASPGATTPSSSVPASQPAAATSPKTTTPKSPVLPR